MMSPQNCQLQKKFDKGGGGVAFKLKSAAYSHYNHRHVENGCKLAEIAGREGSGGRKREGGLWSKNVGRLLSIILN